MNINIAPSWTLNFLDKVHAKYLELGHEKIETLGQLLREVGAEAEFIFAEAARKNSRGKFVQRGHAGSSRGGTITNRQPQ